MSGKFPFQEQPLCSYYGHTADVLDLSWSKVCIQMTNSVWHIPFLSPSTEFFFII